MKQINLFVNTLEQNIFDKLKMVLAWWPWCHDKNNVSSV